MFRLVHLNLNYMKFILSSIFLFIFFISSQVLGSVFFKEYSIYTSGIKIGKLSWELKINNNNYSNNIKLKNSGLLSSLYNFEGNYFSSWNIHNNVLTPSNYKHNWITNKVNKEMKLVFSNNKLKYLEQNPIEKEGLRINAYEIYLVKDPLSSFLQIIFGADSSMVIDGRRVYTMISKYNKNTNEVTIQLVNYSNLWADHKRSQFEKMK